MGSYRPYAGHCPMGHQACWSVDYRGSLSAKVVAVYPPYPLCIIASLYVIM